ncbi:hypothetical protein UM93_12500 [Psychromicrobium lacuslunae]|uniref:Uncharacterized protein n=2 Tax=Psychromicrobium lacuslunae TaxID=1618207 RepID=A0A0D4C1A4_9MICC|nr:hypothetical protein UM93_12500 [Psychromicrobium lacuslunae]
MAYARAMNYKIGRSSALIGWGLLLLVVGGVICWFGADGVAVASRAEGQSTAIWQLIQLLGVILLVIGFLALLIGVIRLASKVDALYDKAHDAWLKPTAESSADQPPAAEPGGSSGAGDKATESES